MLRRIWGHLARRARSEEGFTLIELLVVLAILAVIAALAIPRIAETKTTAKAKVDTANKAILQSAIERYHIEQEKWPTTDGNAPGQLSKNALVPGYLAKDLDPSVATYSIDASGLLTP